MGATRDGSVSRTAPERSDWCEYDDAVAAIGDKHQEAECGQDDEKVMVSSRWLLGADPFATAVPDL